MKQIITEDKSITFYNEEVGDHYHTKSGAREEAFEKHAKALGVDKVKKPVIFDICFGLGYNAAAALDMNPDSTVYCFENDKIILKEILNIEADFKSFDKIKKFVKLFLEKGETKYENLIMIFGDAKEEIKKNKCKSGFCVF